MSKQEMTSLFRAFKREVYMSWRGDAETHPPRVGQVLLGSGSGFLQGRP